ncbi:zinc finger CCCH domain-containing protein 18-like [Branchiostoma floridae]|uniref:Zinc finger CCCH domain-containing protein 18-like n=1 Tax=Branchiostoma floridae TaxID=7739 RepID=A0A9J7LDY3_BRAFL|nr:zinc finger CCCH domain-containing protein 18-like [Branchiostoma floridae]
MADQSDRVSADQSVGSTAKVLLNVDHVTADQSDAATPVLDEHEAELDYDEDVEEHTSVHGGEEPEQPEPDTSNKLGQEDKEEGDGEKKEATDNGEKSEEGEDDDDGELGEDDDLEEGEVKDPSGRKPMQRSLCRFYVKGNCTWGASCRFLHPGINDKGAYSMIDRYQNQFGGPGILGPHPMGPNMWAGPVHAEEDMPPPPIAEPPVESAWERGLRHAKELRKKAMQRKEQDEDFEDKRMNLSLPEEEFDNNKENDFFRRQASRTEGGPFGFQEEEPDYPFEPPPPDQYWQPGQYENFSVRWTREPEPHYTVHRAAEPSPTGGKQRQERMREREREREMRMRERERADRERMRERRRERRPRSMSPPERRGPRPPMPQRPPRRPRDDRPERPRQEGRPDRADRPNRPDRPPRSEATAPRVRADEWKDPWRRSKSPKGRKPSPRRSRSRGRRRRRSSSRRSSVSYSGSSSLSSRSRSSSYSSYSSRSSSGSSYRSGRSSSRSVSPSPERKTSQSPKKKEGAEKEGTAEKKPPTVAKKEVSSEKTSKAPPQKTKDKAPKPEATKDKKPSQKKAPEPSAKKPAEAKSGPKPASSTKKAADAASKGGKPVAKDAAGKAPSGDKPKVSSDVLASSVQSAFLGLLAIALWVSHICVCMLSCRTFIAPSEDKPEVSTVVLASSVSLPFWGFLWVSCICVCMLSLLLSDKVRKVV